MISVCSLSMVSGSTGGGGADVVGGELLLLLSVVIRSSVVVGASGVSSVVVTVDSVVVGVGSGQSSRSSSVNFVVLRHFPVSFRTLSRSGLS
jgi:hypothetical protein